MRVESHVAKDRNAMTYEQLVATLKKFRRDAESAEAEYFIQLVVTEREREAVWRSGGCETYRAFLVSNDLCEVRRYELFACGLDRVGVKQARAHGVGWTVQAGAFRDPAPERIQEYAKLAASFEGRHNTAPSEQSAERMRQATDAPPARNTRETDAAKASRLSAENKELRAQIKKLERENAKLRKELERAGHPSVPLNFRG